MVSTFPLGNRVQPSSELLSSLPVPVEVQVKVAASNSACFVLQQSPIMNVLFGKTTVGASPIADQPLGGFTELTNVPPMGSKIAPWLVSTAGGAPLYSPPSIRTRPPGNTAEPKN